MRVVGEGIHAGEPDRGAIDVGPVLEANGAACSAGERNSRDSGGTRVVRQELGCREGEGDTRDRGEAVVACIQRRGLGHIGHRHRQRLRVGQLSVARAHGNIVDVVAARIRRRLEVRRGLEPQEAGRGVDGEKVRVGAPGNRIGQGVAVCVGRGDGGHVQPVLGHRDRRSVTATVRGDDRSLVEAGDAEELSLDRALASITPKVQGGNACIGPADDEIPVRKHRNRRPSLRARKGGVDLKLGPHLLAGRIEDLGKDLAGIPGGRGAGAVRIDPDNDEAAAGQASNRWVQLQSCRRGVDGEFGTDRRAVRRKDPRLHPGAGHVAPLVEPGHHEAAIRQRRHLGQTLLELRRRVDQEFRPPRPVGAEDARLDTLQTCVAAQAAFIGPGDHEAAVRKRGHG